MTSCREALSLVWDASSILIHWEGVEMTWKLCMKYEPVASAFRSLGIHEIQTGRACFARLYGPGCLIQP